MDATGAGFDEALAEATALGYAEADPTADVDGYDAAAKAAILAGLAFHTRVTDVRRVPRGHRRRHRRRHRQRQRHGLHGEAARDLRAHRRRRRPGAGRRPRAPGDDPALAPAGRGGRCLQRRLRRGRGRRLADVLRPGRRRCPDGQRGAGRPRRRRAQPGQRQPRCRRECLRRPARAARWATPSPATTSPSTSPTSRACWRASPAPSPPKGVSIKTVRQEGRGDAATLVLVTHAATDAALGRTVEKLSGMSLVARVGQRHARRGCGG